MAKRHYVEIEEGISPYQVVQRGADGNADIRFAGSTTVPNGTAVEVRLLRFGQPMPRFPWEEAGTVARGTFSGIMPGVPTGGEYTLEVRAADKGKTIAGTACPGILVGDLWALAGQSNMEGCGRLDAPDVEEPSPLVHAFDMSDRWLTACEPLHWRIDSPDPAHWPEARRPIQEEILREHAGRTNGVGPGLSFGRELIRHTGIPVGLIPCAVGGTSLEQWNPEQLKLGGKSLYGAMLRRIHAAGGVTGLLWFQGESDAIEGSVRSYPDRFRRFIERLRQDLSRPQFPVIFVQLARLLVEPAAHGDWNAMQEVQRLCADQIPDADMVPAVDLPMQDFVHLGSAAQRRLGERLAAVALRRVYGWRDLKVGPRLDSISVGSDGTVRVRYHEVNSRLVAGREVCGFSIRDPDGNDLGLLVGAEIDPDAPSVVVLRIRDNLPPTACLWYGFGPTPCCNLTDELDMGAPVFGPYPLAAD